MNINAIISNKRIDGTVSDNRVITGQLRTLNTLSCSITNTDEFTCTIQDNTQTIFADVVNTFEIGGSVIRPEIYEQDYDVYTGETTVTPSTHENQVLSTANKLVQENITVEQIPTFETSNAYGISFIIGD